MKKLFIVANWKSYKTDKEAIEWLTQMKDHALSSNPEKEIIVCPPYPFLPGMQAFIKENNLSIKLGVQNVSAFAEGAYTGEINSKQIAPFVTHAIVGHSERRKYFHETDQDVLEKVKQLIAANIMPILCISDIAQLDHYLSAGSELVDNAEKIIFVYEPPSAISGGGAFHAESPEVANTNAAEISKKVGKTVITIYGGSVNPENVASLFGQEHIAGGLIGQASLNTESFLKMINS